LLRCDVDGLRPEIPSIEAFDVKKLQSTVEAMHSETSIDMRGLRVADVSSYLKKEAFDLT
jgi:hypothetical protein